MSKLLQFLIQNKAFKRWSKSVGGVAFGLWLGANYHKQIRGVLDAVGMSRDEWESILFAIASAGLIGGSHVLSWFGDKKDKRNIVKPEGNGGTP